MLGGPDPLYVAARRTLLDALEAIQQHREAIILVGAQAVYAHTGAGELAVTPHTTDGDLALDPARLLPEPRIDESLTRAEFVQLPPNVGAWRKQITVDGILRITVVDLLVPESLGGPGRRVARIPPHGRQAARKVHGLEGTLVDRDVRRIHALDPTDDRELEVAVPGPSGLLVAKIHKINDRVADPGRRADKDAVDVYRLLQAVPTSELVQRMKLLTDDARSSAVAAEALEMLPELFGRPRAIGCAMAARAAAAPQADETIAAATAVLTEDLLRAIGA